MHRRVVLTSALAAAAAAGTPPSLASAAPSLAVAAAPSTPGVPPSDFPDLSSADPLHEGIAVPPSKPQVKAPAARLAQIDVPPGPLTFTFKSVEYGIHDIARDEYPYNKHAPIPLEDTGVKDSSGIRMHKIGNTLYDHPVAQAQYGLELLESYVVGGADEGGDVRYLNRAKAHADRLIARARQVGMGLYLPYPFDFLLHGDPNERMVAPWYSAMAQGQGMSLFVRLFETTGEQKYRDAADGIFGSFLRSRASANPWTVWVDSNQYLWLEEYAKAVPDRTLNGHMFAVYGLWDYWRLTQDERAVQLFRGALTLAATYYPQFRNTNWISQYCLQHPTVASSKYHEIHISQFTLMYALTRNLAFLRIAEFLAADYPPITVDNSVSFQPGNHTGVKFSSGTIRESKTITLARASSAPANSRERVLNQPGYWYRITAGSLSGYYVQEKLGAAVLMGQYMTIPYLVPRAVTMKAGVTVRGVAFAENGNVTSTETLVPSEDTQIGTLASAWWNAQQYMLIEDGPLGGRWVLRSSLVVS